VPTCIALLRSVNLTGHNRIAMADLRAVFEVLGHSDVVTYVQSGNVVFTTGAADPAALAAAIERRITRDLGLEITTLVRTTAELARVVAGNPLLTRGRDPAHLHVTFLAAPAPAARVKAIDPSKYAPEAFAVRRREVYLYCPNGYGRTRLGNAFFERALGTAATTRSWKTVTKLVELARG
jgi:uncharacterized protein (DUF1697 family)